MNYNVLYTNSKDWKSVLLWKKTIVKEKNIWSSDKLSYNENLDSLHSNFNLYKFGHNGILASTMMCMNGAFKLLTSNYQDIDRLFIDEIIEIGVDMHQAFVQTESGKRYMERIKKSIIPEANMLGSFFSKILDINYFDTKLVAITGVDQPSIYNFNEWLYNNMNFYTDKVKNVINEFCVIVNINNECYLIYFDIEKSIYLLFDPHGRGSSFFNIPSNQSQDIFLTEINEEVPYSNMNSYILRTQDYNMIIKFIENNLPYRRNFTSTYITLR